MVWFSFDNASRYAINGHSGSDGADLEGVLSIASPGVPEMFLIEVNEINIALHFLAFAPSL